MKIEKKHEGAVIYALPTGNNARDSKGEYEEFKAVKVKRRYVDLQRVGSSYVESYDVESGAQERSIRSGYASNSGYIFFESLADLRSYKDRLKMLNKIGQFFRGIGWQRSLTPEQIEQIYAQLPEDNT